LFQVIVDDLETAISDGTYTLGQQLPSQRELQAVYGVSRETVSKALGLLRRAGLISTTQGGPATVTVVPGRAVPPAGSTGQAQGNLRAALREAFEADEITMDVLSLTSETMAQHLGEPVTRIITREISPQSITLRLMLPEITGMRLAFPRAVSDPDDDRPRKRHRDMVISYAKSLRHSLLSLRYQGLVEKVSVQIRTVPFTPPLKVYLLNKDQLLEGFYALQKWTPAPIQGEEVEILDSLAKDAPLFPYSRRDYPLKVDTAQDFFDSYWGQLAQVAKFDD
jgi:DNA-binding transcriptional regulator YhcF (GntR family)